jgi:hypothetical protein
MENIADKILVSEHFSLMRQCQYTALTPNKAQQHWKMMSPMLLSFKWQKFWKSFGQRCPNAL